MIEKSLFWEQYIMEVLKHIVLFLISPLNLVMLLFAVGMLVSFKKVLVGKVFVYSSVIAFLLLTQPYFSDLLLYPLEHDHHYPEIQDGYENPDYILVLACYYSTLGDIPETSRWSECSMQRNIEALRLHRKSGAKIIISGGNFLHDPSINYSQKAKDFFVELGVNQHNIITTKSGTNTKEEIKSALPYLRKANTWVVSSATHIYRLKKLFAMHDCSGEFFPVDHHSRGELVPYLTLPSAYALTKIELALYEYAALLKQSLSS